ncbi:S-adenosylmethionine decarboxylase [Paenibacillus validus]|uniref:S-adenosylmethionine decarboxylase n=1 Tax=Paenibacillus validus TaxID=44253 RepID=A0A7X3CQE9_9BACL|nr:MULTISPECIES: S-adenosylmethionine decarboxylase [Paenibacillus]MED4601180.1 S-adenosylmethionine decarboxylase [Paenibacillus validus]MED4605834.1 S-adenosylmethionine decarboxylase [Paenibacillus validus]MUG69097.1 S-adenosylmethionine decarboxylase [Paenibacillus validus]
MKRQRKKWFMYAVVGVLVLWSGLQIVELAGRGTPVERADKMLYQVARFQMELLGSHLTESAKAKDTDGLNSLRQAAYSAAYAHEHLVLAYGEGKLAKLEAPSKLLQYLVRLQIAGTRPLKADEQQTLAEAARGFAALFAAYGSLMSPGDAVVSSQNTKLTEADKALAELLDRKLLP